jgi:acetylornithine/N-succinyldiaminopimelate aminotransferase
VLRQNFFTHIAQTIDTPLALEIERAEGVFLYGPDGKKYLDLISGISVSNLGHCHPAVVKAVQEQVSKFSHLMVYGEYVYNPAVRLATKLCSLLPTSLNNVYFTNSGAEAVEGALKLARRHTGRTEIISFRNAYHGSTAGALSVMGDEYYKSSYRPLVPGNKILDYIDFDQIQKISSATAGVIIEPVQAEAGIILPMKGYLEAVKKRCEEVGALMILDEIQTGMGRTGSLFAFEQYDFVPDILLLAKAFGGGMPLGAFIADKSVMQSLSHSPILGHITTFGGNAVCCAAGEASLDVLTSGDIIKEVESKGKLFDKSFLNHPKLKSFTRAGLLISLGFEDFETNKKIIDACIEKGVITDWFLFCNDRMRIAPPLLINEEEINLALNTILETIDILL